MAVRFACMEKAQALGAASQSFAQLRRASQSFAQLRTASHSFAELRRMLQPKLLWLGEWLSDPQHSPLPPYACVRACSRVLAYVRESSSEAMRSLAKP